MRLHEEFKLFETMWDEPKDAIEEKMTETLDFDELATRGGRNPDDPDEEPLFTDMLYLKDLNELAEYATHCFGTSTGGIYNPITLRKYVLEDADVEMPDWVRKALETVISDVGSTLLRDGKIGDPDAFMQINNIMETLHYDNGKPLSCDDYNFFDHYDRDQDFWGFYEDVEIYDFITDGKDLYARMDISFDELKACLTDMYDGSSWDHDFR
jgi:hypothetical protein